MVYFTGDIHGEAWHISAFANKMQPGKTDIIVILGDVGANYTQNYRDREMKSELARLKPTVFCIHGNHEMRPWHIPTYRTKEWHGGIVWYEERYPNLLFAKDGEIYEIGGLRYMAIGGAYSVDKEWRLAHSAGWWDDEQPSDEIKAYVERQLGANRVDVILSHTCPYRYIPREVLLSQVDQAKVDHSTERWLDRIEENTDYQAWYCGHFHVNKRIDKMHFLFDEWEYISE